MMMIMMMVIAIMIYSMMIYDDVDNEFHGVKHQSIFKHSVVLHVL
jgi:hypothetical protein